MFVCYDDEKRKKRREKEEGEKRRKEETRSDLVGNPPAWQTCAVGNYRSEAAL